MARTKESGDQSRGQHHIPRAGDLTRSNVTPIQDAYLPGQYIPGQLYAKFVRGSEDVASGKAPSVFRREQIVELLPFIDQQNWDVRVPLVLSVSDPTQGHKQKEFWLVALTDRPPKPPRGVDVADAEDYKLELKTTTRRPDGTEVKLSDSVYFFVDPELALSEQKNGVKHEYMRSLTLLSFEENEVTAIMRDASGHVYLDYLHADDSDQVLASGSTVMGLAALGDHDQIYLAGRGEVGANGEYYQHYQDVTDLGVPYADAIAYEASSRDHRQPQRGQPGNIDRIDMTLITAHVEPQHLPYI